jgi:abortive infection bacteriophage resistance protein
VCLREGLGMMGSFDLSSLQKLENYCAHHHSVWNLAKDKKHLPGQDEIWEEEGKEKNDRSRK